MRDRLLGRQDDYRRALADPVRFDVAFYAGLYAEALEAHVRELRTALRGIAESATEILKPGSGSWEDDDVQFAVAEAVLKESVAAALVVLEVYKEDDSG